MDVSKILSFTDNPVFRLYATYASAVILKMMFLSIRTGHLRTTRKVGTSKMQPHSHIHKLQNTKHVVLSTQSQLTLEAISRSDFPVPAPTQQMRKGATKLMLYSTCIKLCTIFPFEVCVKVCKVMPISRMDLNDLFSADHNSF